MGNAGNWTRGCWWRCKNGNLSAMQPPNFNDGFFSRRTFLKGSRESYIVFNFGGPERQELSCTSLRGLNKARSWMKKRQRPLSSWIWTHKRWIIRRKLYCWATSAMWLLMEMISLEALVYSFDSGLTLGLKASIEKSFENYILSNLDWSGFKLIVRY